MRDQPHPSSLQRRSFVSRLGAGLAAFGSAFVVGAPALGAQGEAQGNERSVSGDWRPARHPQDDWLEQIPGKHRFFFDAISPNGAGEAITFASNFYNASKSGYALEDGDNAVVICLRHWATPFAFTDAIWAKYGGPLSERIRFTDPKSQRAPTTNVYQASGYGMQLTSRGTTLDQMIGRGTHFAICDAATRAFAGIVAGKLGLESDAVYREMREHTIGNAHYMAAGIVAVNRAQERGYSIQYIG